MKCPRCMALNCADDQFCMGCRSSLAPARKAAAREEASAATPQWGYFFAAMCGAIPVVTIGGLIPVMIGLGGAGICLAIARTYSVHPAVRFVASLSVTLVCWAVLVAVLVELNPTAKDNLDKMLKVIND